MRARDNTRRHRGIISAATKHNENVQTSSDTGEKIKLESAKSWKCRRLFVFSAVVFSACFIFMMTRSSLLSGSPLNVSSPPIIEAMRFPKYNSLDFLETCSWTKDPVKESSNCTILVRPRPIEHEGMVQWLCQIVTNYIDSRVRNCKLLVDYGPDVDLSQVMAPHFDWLAPKGFQCDNENACEMGWKTAISDRTPNIPFYRGVYAAIPSPLSRLKRGQYRNLEQHLPGFHLETGMSCSLAALFDLAPTASQYEPELFTKLLPTLRDKSALVMTVYIRTGLTDQMVREERNASAANNSKATLEMQRRTANMSISCALHIEQEYLSRNDTYSKVVWMVVTDSANLKKDIVNEYSSENVLYEGSNNKTTLSPIPRLILTTQARGKHTRTARKPSTADFAEALIDWYLIGESDVVVSESTVPSSFETTAALRTNRPVYITPAATPRINKGEIKQCVKREWLYDD